MYRLVRESLTIKVPIFPRPKVDPIDMRKTIYLFQAEGRTNTKTMSMTAFDMIEE